MVLLLYPRLFYCTGGHTYTKTKESTSVLQFDTELDGWYMITTDRKGVRYAEKLTKTIKTVRSSLPFLPIDFHTLHVSLSLSLSLRLFYMVLINILYCVLSLNFHKLIYTSTTCLKFYILLVISSSLVYHKEYQLRIGA